MTAEENLARIEQQLAALEALRGTLPPEAFDAARAGLEMQRAALAGSGAIAQGPGATAVGAGGIAIGGNVQGSQLVSGNDNVTGGGEARKGGIHVGRIEGAKKVTIGADVQGGSAAGAAALATALLDGSISVEQVLNSEHVAVGLRYVSDARQPTGEELRAEIAALRAQLEAALRQGEVADRGVVEDAVEALDSAEAELAKEQPDGPRVLRRLRHVAAILVETNKVTDAAKGVASTVATLAPYAAAIAQLAATTFGG